MRLAYSSGSPFVRKVMTTLRELGQTAAVELIPAPGTVTDPSPARKRMNPLAKVPALERDDGPMLYDSPVICRYLDHRFGGSLYPAGPALWEALTLEATADGMMDAAVLMVYESRIRPEGMRYAPWVEGQWAKVAGALDVLERQWLAHLAGPFTIGSLALACALAYLDVRHPDRGWREGHPGLADWHARAMQRPSLAQPMPEV